MEQYIRPEMEVIAFETEDVITTSGDGYTPLPDVPLGGSPASVNENEW